MSDQVVPFAFESLPVRGAIVQLGRAWQRMQEPHEYSRLVTETLGQSAAATALIAQSLKFDGAITMQLQSRGELRMLVMQSTHALELRGMATTGGEPGAEQFSELVRDAHCAITIDNGERPYQGIVEVSEKSLTASLENYFRRSVQLPSLLALFADADHASGLLLQQLPDEARAGDDDWRRLGLILDTLKATEIRDDDPVTLIGKLFAEDDVRVFPSRPVSFHCRCSAARAEDVLRMLGPEEAESALAEQEAIEITCEFCGRIRRYDAVDVSRLFAENVVGGSDRVQ